jgi:predicted DNA-binding transcriptional regulator YafY
MASPTSRLLELLELLQARPLTTGREIADRLEVDARTVRRYVGVLQGLGIPIEGQRGVGGGYRIRPGYRLPPLMLENEEAVAVVLGLLPTRESGRDSAPDAVAGALTKINRVLPSTLRRQVEALEETLDFTTSTRSAPADAALVLQLADAIRRRRRLHAAYHSFSGEESERELSPYGLVVHSGCWYVVAHDHKRDDLRTFRVDRMWRTTLAEGSFVPATGRLRRSRAPDALAGRRSLAVAGRGPARPAGRRGGATHPRDARRARRRPRRHAPAYARELARLDGERPRRSRLRFHDPRAGGAAGKCSRAREAACRAA